MTHAARSSAAKSKRRKTSSWAGTLIGLLVGVVVGLAAAVVVAFYMNRAATPFVEKVKRPLEAAKAGELPDPNRPLLRARAAAPESLSAAPANPATSLASASPSASAEAAPAAPEDTGAAPAVAIDPSTYWLQVGAFRGQEDADAMKAKLALMGIEASIAQAEVNGVVFYRVRMGPYAQLEIMGAARNRLAESGIEASVVRQR